MNLSSNQRKLLKNILFNKGDSNSHSKNTLNALKRRHLINDENILTKEGFLKSLELIPLNQQCEFLSLDLNTKTLKYLENPELQAYKLFKSEGFIGTFCEGGGILTVIKALSLDKLTELNTFNSREDSCTRFLEAQLTILSDYKDEILNSILKTSKTRFINNFSEIISYKSTQEYYPGLTIEFAKKLEKKLSRKVFCQIADTFFQSPYDYRKGWPDLTLVSNKKIRFVEIKTTDKLHHSQIQIIDKFSSIIPAKFEVLKLVQENNLS